ncbi:GntR family transcriptional regulator [Pseudovibrio sp. Tun.PSC04-5.I4]|uniref:GntR family transcriptional regulator n=1 Tax=Pseudovibrio sp. Tun.PSC04-5.I4 TaxID=1798213 RepID=UPI00087F8E36|nr:GntR family transcriptional regulator [Pseudovibrio sp. Tun.PSC04-5.I4]SDQ21583.1 DNA-binding transcriptional regulator, GntR family [Pseudovibrio sp. Tun.PSC04-5.I4]
MSTKPKLGQLESTFAAQEDGTIAVRVYNTMKKCIIQLMLMPGSSISEADVSKTLGVSRQPVREAFIKLADVGLVEIRPQRGTFVVMISRRDVKNAQFMREALEVAMVRKAATADDKDTLVAELDRIIERQELASKQKDNKEFLRLDEAFHSAIAAGVDCALGWRLVSDMKIQLDRVRFLSLNDATPVSALVAQHRAIVSAIASGDMQIAQETMEVHLREILKSLPAIERDNEELFCA